MKTDFDHAGEKAWGVGLTYDFAGTLLPVPGSRLARAPGLRAGHGHCESLDGKQ